MTETTPIAGARADQSLPPWQFFLLCGMLGATAVVIVATGQSIANIIVLSLTVVAASFAGLGAYRMLGPLVSAAASKPVAALPGGRTRAALQREKALALRAIKELEFDFAMGKLSQADFDEMSGRLRRRAMRLMQQLDSTQGYREQIERDVAALVSTPRAARSTAPSVARESTGRAAAQTCPSCRTANDADARFCKQCATPLVM
jgi:hypothetical protein